MELARYGRAVQAYAGRSYIGHSYIGHSCRGHDYIGHTYLGHNYIGTSCHSSSAHAPEIRGKPKRLELVPDEHPDVFLRVGLVRQKKLTKKNDDKDSLALPWKPTGGGPTYRQPRGHHYIITFRTALEAITI